MTRILKLSVLSLFVLSALSISSAEEPRNVRLRVVRQHSGPVLTIHDDGAAGNKYGFEGGRVVKVGNTYHLFTSEMTGDPHWVKMRLAHWTSTNRTDWKRQGTLYESSGDFTGGDRRAALWSPMPVFDRNSQRWNLFYVAYQAAPDTMQRWLTNHEGRIWRAVSEMPGWDGIDGPYRDTGIILERGKDSDSWEGLQGTDSFFPYSVGDKWYAFYGSAHTEKLPIALWQVGLASASSLDGAWSRCTNLNPVGIEPRFIENPVVARLSDGTYVAVYDNHQPNGVGYSASVDGLHWSRGQHLVVQSGNGVWASEVRTPLGLIDESDGVFTLFYTANEKAAGTQPDAYGVTLTPGAVGFVEVRITTSGEKLSQAGTHISPAHTRPKQSARAGATATRE